MKKIFIVTGEQSGDMHAAALVESLKKRDAAISISAIGGAYLKQQSVTLFKSIEGMAVIGVIEALKKIFFFKKLLEDTIEYIKITKPDIIILVDYPGFNLKLAERIKKNNISAKLIYYISPQIWAWHTSRVYKINKLFDKILVIFKFEKDFYDKYLNDKNKCVFVGHPLIKRINPDYYYEKKSIKKKYLLILPGSRIAEIQKLLPELVKTALKINNRYPEYKIIISAADQNKIKLIKAYIPNELNNYIIVAGNVYSLLQNCSAAIVASGTATLETGIIGAPMVAVYKVNYLTGLLGKLLIKIKNIALINIVLGSTVVKEFIQSDMNAEKIFKEISNIINDNNYADALHSRLTESRNLLQSGGMENIAATEIIKLIES